MLKKIFFKLLLIFYFLLVTQTSSHAYLDPGTGSVILTAILGTLAALLATVQAYWIKFKKLIIKLLNKSKKENKT